MDRSKNFAHALIPAFTKVHAAFLGGGAAANCTVPSDGVLTSTTSTFPKQANLGTSATYVSTGLYTIVLSQSVKNILFASAAVVSAGGSPTAVLAAEVTKIDPPTGLTVKVTTPAGVLTDLGTSDMLILSVEVADTGAINS